MPRGIHPYILYTYDIIYSIGKKWCQSSHLTHDKKTNKRTNNFFKVLNIALHQADYISSKEPRIYQGCNLLNKNNTARIND